MTIIIKYIRKKFAFQFKIPFIQLTNSIRDLCLTFIPQLMTTKQFLNSEDSGSIISDSEELNKSIILGKYIFLSIRHLYAIFSAGSRYQNNQ